MGNGISADFTSEMIFRLAKQGGRIVGHFQREN
jgi:hypothetical protein